VLAVDGTNLHANASQHENRDYELITREILAEADAVDHAEDERFGERLHEGKRRLEEDHDAHRRANEAYEAYPARGVMKDGARFGKPPSPYVPPVTPAGKVNVTDPDSRNLKTPWLHAGLQDPGGLQHTLGLRRTRRPAVEGVSPLWLPPDPPSGLSPSP
jgi:hypothetical protein